MRIGINFHTSDNYISGVEYYSLGLLKGLLHIDKRNDYVVYTNQPDLVREHVSSFENLTINGIGHPKIRLARILWEHTQLPGLAVKEKLDVLHCLSYICPICRSSVPYVVTVHDTIAIDHPRWCKPTNALYFNLSMGAAIRRASRVISVSECTADDLKRNFQLCCSKLRVIYPGVDGIFNASADFSHQDEVRKRYGLPDRYVLFVGNIEPKKNIGTLLRVLAKLREQGLPHKLVLTGKRTWRSGSELGGIYKEAASGNIVLAGYVARNDLPPVYQMADVFVFLSLYEGFGFPPLEAMACGTPVVSSSRGALKETIGNSAIVVDPLDVDEITQAVISMATNTSLREKYVRLGLKKSRFFNWDKSAGQMLSVYEEVYRTNG
jgi:glycosyltransferase involved in cell wall biosynthesis